jgi:hypothetical protein
MLRTEQVMTLTDRMIIAGIANNPANYEGEGEYRYSIPHEEIYFSSASEPHEFDNEQWIALPSLDPDGSKRKERAFKNFIRRRWVPSRQKELETFARRRGWDLAMELKYGGGALEDNEAEEWQYVINRELARLVHAFREQAGQRE